MDAGGDARAIIRPRPDHTALYGVAGSRARLSRLVGEAVKSIDRFKERGAELRHLALSLLDTLRRGEKCLRYSTGSTVPMI